MFGRSLTLPAVAADLTSQVTYLEEELAESRLKQKSVELEAAMLKIDAAKVAEMQEHLSVQEERLATEQASARDAEERSAGRERELASELLKLQNQNTKQQLEIMRLHSIGGDESQVRSPLHKPRIDRNFV